MSVIRDLGLTVGSLEDTTALFGGSTGTQTFGSTSLASTAFSSGVSGRVIDRLTDLFTKDVPVVAMPATIIYSSRGSTATDRKLTLGVKLQHGDSSGGGDMADYSTQSQPDDQIYFSSARTTDMAYWSTGPLRAQSEPSYYDLRAAKRYIRAVHTVSKGTVTTESTGDEGARVSGVITFLGGATPKTDLKAVGSTSTST
jgi:hypothetical protein